MIISHRHGFIFIKSPKTAGSSIQAALEPLCGDDDVVTHVWPREPGLENYRERNAEGWHSHLSAVKIRELADQNVWDEYYKFAFERNPWDRTVSNYWFRRWGRGRKAKAKFKQTREDPIGMFPEWLEIARLQSNVDMYTNDDLKIIVDFVGLYERLADDFAAICSAIGIECPPLGQYKTAYRENKMHYSHYYQGDQALIDKVAEAYRHEIELFGYEFEEEDDTRPTE